MSPIRYFASLARWSPCPPRRGRPWTWSAGRRAVSGHPRSHRRTKLVASEGDAGTCAGAPRALVAWPARPVGEAAPPAAIQHPIAPAGGLSKEPIDGRSIPRPSFSSRPPRAPASFRRGPGPRPRPGPTRRPRPRRPCGPADRAAARPGRRWWRSARSAHHRRHGHEYVHERRGRASRRSQKGAAMEGGRATPALSSRFACLPERRTLTTPGGPVQPSAVGEHVSTCRPASAWLPAHADSPRRRRTDPPSGGTSSR